MKTLFVSISRSLNQVGSKKAKGASDSDYLYWCTISAWHRFYVEKDINGLEFICGVDRNKNEILSCYKCTGYHLTKEQDVKNRIREFENDISDKVIFEAEKENLVNNLKSNEHILRQVTEYGQVEFK
jgi:hypothetical protein